jgi:hypothetical protein
MKKLGIEPGDYVEIVGKNIAYAQVWPAYPEDEDKDVILVDSVIKKNANMNIGDIVKVKKAVLRPAQKVVLAPTKPAEVDPEYLKKQLLLGKPVTRGQMIITPFYGDVIKFVVLQVEPEPAAYVSIDTDVIIKGIERASSSEGYSKPIAMTYVRDQSKTAETVNVADRVSLSDTAKPPTDVAAQNPGTDTFLSVTGLSSRELSASKELLLGTADLLRAFGFFLLFVAFIFVATNYDAVEFNMPIFISSVGYFISALISPIVSTFADRRTWVSALIGALGAFPYLAYMSKASEGAPAGFFVFAVLWLGTTVAITVQTRLDEWDLRQSYTALAGVIGVGYIVLAIAKTIDAIRRYARAV